MPTKTRWIALSLLHLCGAAVGQHAVSPADRAALEGNSFTHYPLGRRSARVQTLHDDVPGGVVIGAHGYRRDAVGVRGVVTGLKCDLQVTLSMAPHAADAASATFADNIGGQPVVVLPRQLVTIPPTQRPQVDPSPSFDLVIPYTQPFAVPAGGGTLCVDVEVFGNRTASGDDRDVSVYLDAHRQYADGRAQQRGYRTLRGCPAPGSQTACYAALDLWRMPSATTSLDVSIRNGVFDQGGGTTRAFLTIGNQRVTAPWPLRSDCPFHSSAELWFALPGGVTTAGSYDGTLPGLPLLPAGMRLWCQAGTIDLSTAAMAFSDAVTMVTPPNGAVPRPCARVANGADVTSATGAISRSVPVMCFY
ncbi:MAG: hypothetical protein VYA51_10500 [Planctomycetota bacterium]|nr:hypothetical protein [Planctomycetota bacterium]